MNDPALFVLWRGFQDGEALSDLEHKADCARTWFYLAVLAFARGDNESAARYARQAAHDDANSRVYPAATQYLDRIGRSGRHEIYTRPEAFTAFIRGGGNAALYAALQQRLRDRYERLHPTRLLDIGPGDGEALLPALGDSVGHVDIVEPSPSLYRHTLTQLRHRRVPHDGVNAGLEQLPGSPLASRSWDLAQATFSLHNLDPQARREALAWLRPRVNRILIAEFDLDPKDSCHPEWFLRVVRAYENGLAEYDGDGGLVAQGFLMPVMFGYFDPDVTHDERPILQWQQDLHDAGFTRQLEPVLLHDYWWAPGYLLEAA